jgi:DNA-directed RNA polymerase subunit F
MLPSCSQPESLEISSKDQLLLIMKNLKLGDEDMSFIDDPSSLKYATQIQKLAAKSDSKSKEESPSIPKNYGEIIAKMTKFTPELRLSLT